MQTFLKWLNEYSGGVLPYPVNTRAHRFNGVASKWNAEGNQEGDKDPVNHKKADCKYLGINCGKKNK
jgi:hypothetical protein